MRLRQSLSRNDAFRCCAISVAVVWAVSLPGRLCAAADPPLPQQKVRRAIEKGRDWLLREQEANGTWECAMRTEDTRVGATALVMLALANAGVEVEHPALRKSLEWLRRQSPDETYSVSLQTMVLAMLAPDTDRPILERNVKWLEGTQVRQGPAAGSWSYGKAKGAGDNSNSHFALLALHEADRAGVRVSPAAWKLAHQYWVSCANSDGSWGYTIGNSGGSGSMTCAGIASVWITSEHIDSPDAQDRGETVACCGVGSSPKVLERGLDWLGKRFTVLENPGGGQTWHFYYLYGLERVGRFTARRFIGQADWYLEGAKMFVKTQDAFTGAFRGGPIEDPVVATSFALLFLATGRRPVIVAKSSHDPASDWNRHGHDIAHLVEHVESRWRRNYPAGLCWHLLDTPRAALDDFCRAPVLWLSGKNEFDLGPEAGSRLREYIDEGGFIFAEACCPNSDEFDRRFRQLVREIFPEPQGELLPLPPEHPVWSIEQNIPADLRRPLLSVSLQDRTCLIYAPPTDIDDPKTAIPSLSCLWELGGRSLPTLGPLVAREVEGALALGANVLAIALSEPDSIALIPDGRSLADLPATALNIADAEVARKLTEARDKFNKTLSEEREKVRVAIDTVADRMAKKKELDNASRWEAILEDFDNGFVFDNNEDRDVRRTYRNAIRMVGEATRQLIRSYNEARDTLTETRKLQDAKAVEDEGKLLQ